MRFGGFFDDMGRMSGNRNLVLLPLFKRDPHDDASGSAFAS